MRAITQHVHGKLLAVPGKAVFLLTNSEPTQKTAESGYLCFAVLVRGPEDHILPGIVLDDWGNERRDLAIYEWFIEEGHLFPRSELFGFDPDGTEAQCFLRALELYVKYPAYFFSDRQTPVKESVLLDAILLPEATVSSPQRLPKPGPLPQPLSRARVQWWQVPPALSELDPALFKLQS